MNRCRTPLRLRALPLLIFTLVLPAQCCLGAGAPELVAAARKQVGVTINYAPGYASMRYPGGDVPPAQGVCTDVLVRALRELGVDLQKEVHEDMRAHFDRYPHLWGLRAPDTNIDHRRVPNLMTFFARRGCSRPVTASARDYLPGDFVTWDLGGGIPHIGIVSDRSTADGEPLVIHNVGAGAQEEAFLFSRKITGHYRWFRNGNE